MTMGKSQSQIHDNWGSLYFGKPPYLQFGQPPSPWAPTCTGMRWSPSAGPVTKTCCGKFPGSVSSNISVAGVNPLWIQVLMFCFNEKHSFKIGGLTFFSHCHAWLMEGNQEKNCSYIHQGCTRSRTSKKSCKIHTPNSLGAVFASCKQRCVWRLSNSGLTVCLSLDRRRTSAQNHQEAIPSN